MFLLSWVAAALAGEPVLETDAQGVVRGTVVVSAPLDRTLALVRDPARVLAVSGDGGTLRTAPDGDCLVLDYALDTLFADVAYRARGCPTDAGFRAELVESRSFRAMRYEWSARATPDGTELRYEYHADVALPVPSFVVRQQTERALRDTLRRVGAALDVPPG